MHMHTEYTSITDELESVCGLLSPPRTPGLLSPPRPDQSPPSKDRCYGWLTAGLKGTKHDVRYCLRASVQKCHFIYS